MLGTYLGLDSTLVRILWIVLSIVPGAIFFGLIAYLAAWLIMLAAAAQAVTPAAPPPAPPATEASESA